MSTNSDSLISQLSKQAPESPRLLLSNAWFDRNMNPYGNNNNNNVNNFNRLQGPPDTLNQLNLSTNLPSNLPANTFNSNVFRQQQGVNPTQRTPALPPVPLSTNQALPYSLPLQNQVQVPRPVAPNLSSLGQFVSQLPNQSTPVLNSSITSAQPALQNFQGVPNLAPLQTFPGTPNLAPQPQQPAADLNSQIGQQLQRLLSLQQSQLFNQQASIQGPFTSNTPNNLFSTPGTNPALNPSLNPSLNAISSSSLEARANSLRQQLLTAAKLGQLDPQLLAQLPNLDLSFLTEPNAVEPGRQQFVCQVCSRPFNSQSKLLRHLSSHQYQRPYKCTTCGRTFRRKADLKKHTRIHTGEKPYACRICGKKFSDQSNKLRHERAHSSSSRRLQPPPPLPPVTTTDRKDERVTEGTRNITHGQDSRQLAHDSKDNNNNNNKPSVPVRKTQSDSSNDNNSPNSPNSDDEKSVQKEKAAQNDKAVQKAQLLQNNAMASETEI